MPDVNDEAVLQGIIEILEKRPEKREKHEILRILPIVQNINLFANQTNEEKGTSSDQPSKKNETDKLTVDDYKFVAK